MNMPDNPNPEADETTEGHVRSFISDDEQAAVEPRRRAPLLDDESTEGHVLRLVGDAEPAVNRDIDEQTSRPNG